MCHLIPWDEDVAHQHVDTHDGDRDNHTRESDLEESQERNGITLLFTQTNSNNVSTGTNQCTVSSQTGSVTQRPNKRGQRQTQITVSQRDNHRHHSSSVRDVIDESRCKRLP